MDRLNAEHVGMIASEDWRTMTEIVGEPRLLRPDLVIAPSGSPYLYRWFVASTSSRIGGVYMHLQVQDDPVRPFHDHPWDNQSVILAGRYLEVLQSQPPDGNVERIVRRPGDVITRAAGEAHHLILPVGTPYALTLFSFGPVVRDWGFWFPDGWHSHRQHVQERDGKSVHVFTEGAPYAGYNEGPDEGAPLEATTEGD